jgi:TetR/AcrR family transcriptional regulator of autoinduction and epiphytic fitness
MEFNGSTETVPPARRSGSREAIIEAAQGLFLERGFGSVSMDELAGAAGVARRTLYNQFSSKEEIFREMLLRVSGQLEHAFPPGIETQGKVEDVLRLIARAILQLHNQPEYLGFLRMVVADSRQFPWIAAEFAAVMDPQTERLARYFDHLTAMGILDCRNPLLAAHQFMGLLNEFSLWPWMMGRESVPVPGEDVAEEAVHMFLRVYRLPRPKRAACQTYKASANQPRQLATRYHAMNVHAQRIRRALADSPRQFSRGVAQCAGGPIPAPRGRSQSL